RHLQTLLSDLVRRYVKRRLLFQRRARKGHGRAKRDQRRVAGKRGNLWEQAGHRGRDRPRLDGKLRESLQLRIVGQLTLAQQVPDLLERASPGQLGGVVAAVMEEPFLASNVADRGFGHGDALEPARGEPWGSGSRRLHLFDVRDPHDMAYREDTGDVLAIHDGEMAEATLAEDLEPLLHGVGHRDGDRVLGHDLFDLGRAGIDAVPDRTE